MKTKKINHKLTLNKNTISHLSRELESDVRGGTRVSADQRICDSVYGVTCRNCGGSNGCGTYTCSGTCQISCGQRICISNDYTCDC